MDKVTFFEQALHTLGDREYKKDSPTGRECDLWFPSVLVEALNYGSWTFATRRRVLEAESPHTYPLPEDCLRPLRINHSCFELIGRHICLNALFQPAPSSGFSALLGYIERVIIPEGKTSPFKTVDEDAFKGSLRMIEVPENIFENCIEQTSFNNLFDSCWKLQRIPANLFKNCINLTEVISCFNNCITVTEIPSGLFRNNTKLTRVNLCFTNSLYIDNYINLKYVPADLFDNCPSIVWAANCFLGNVNITSALPALWLRGTITAYSRYAGGCVNAANYASIPADWK